MGYSHSWARLAEIPIPEFEAWVDDVKHIVASAGPVLGLFGGVRINGPAGFGRPTLGPSMVALNGSALFSRAHESFIVHRRIQDYRANATPGADNLFWDACKTAQKPYDVVVVAAILAFLERISGSRASSDGERDDWAGGAALFARALRRDPAAAVRRAFEQP